MTSSVLLLDPRAVASTTNARLELGAVQKHPANPLFVEGAFAEPAMPWEARLDNVYPSVIYDSEEDLFKCWYKSFIIDEASNRTALSDRPRYEYFGGEREEGLLYATSADGIHWDKPALGLIEFGGSRQNNIVMRRATHGIHAGGVLMDADDPDPARRYKFPHRNPRAGRMASCFSADGLNWSQPALWPEHDAVGDTHNNAIWSSELRRYVCITRGWSDGSYCGVRTALRSESRDFLHWTEPVEILRGTDAHDQIYSMPIAAYGGLYIGLPAVFHKGSPEAPDWDTVDTELAVSVDTVNWERICPGEALIPRGTGSYPDGEYDCGCVYAAAPLIQGDRILLYYGGSNGRHNDWREGSLNLATLPIDRFAGYAPGDERESATVEIAPLLFQGDRVSVNAEVEPGGWIRAALRDESGSALPGYGVDDFEAISESGLACELRWRDRHMAELSGQRVWLAFEFRNAKLYALTGTAVPGSG
ncbi:MAG: hypothetical protein OXG68_04445 [Chloroflexi bacterium]|nr:hypothetical protein [Chloroflexota bacterium]